MTTPTDAQTAAFFLHSYTAVDGLWFIEVEKRLGFEAALDLDAAVWAVMPKIQARAIKAMTGQQRGLEALQVCLTTKLDWEGHAYAATMVDGGRRLTLSVRGCPWLALLAKSGRTHLAQAIGTRICQTEYTVWAAEFGEDLRFHMGRCLCRGDGVCELCFTRA